MIGTDRTVSTLTASIAGITINLMLSSAAGLASEIPYGVGSWDSDSLGHHRVIVRIEEAADAVRIQIPWRRRDRNPQDKQIIVVDAATGQTVRNVLRARVSQESGDIVIQPITVPGDYFIYYLPFRLQGRRNYPETEYLQPVSTAESDWLRVHGLDTSGKKEVSLDSLPSAVVREFQSIDVLNSFYPMEVIATAEEKESLASSYPLDSYLLFPEDRKFPVRMPDELPYKWVKDGAKRSFFATATRGEFYAFQIGVFAIRENLIDVRVQFEDLHREGMSGLIPSSNFRCFNTGGVDWTGKKFRTTVTVEQGRVQPLWLGVQVPLEAQPGSYRGKVEIVPRNVEPREVELHLSVLDFALEDAGDSEPWKHSRLRWLDSTIGLEDGIVEPFEPVSVEGRAVSCLGRKVLVGRSGLPEMIESFFAPEMTHLAAVGRKVLTSPIRFEVESAAGVLKWEGETAQFTKRAQGVAAWESKTTAGPLTLTCFASMEFDGNIEFRLTLRTDGEVDLKDLRLLVPVDKSVARYMMGLGFRGGLAPDRFWWKWDAKNNQDSVWVGDVNAGVQLSLKDENYSRPLNTNFYLLKPLNLPPSWHNDGKGGIELSDDGQGAFRITAFSGGRTIGPGEDLHFNFRLALTPFKLIDTHSQWTTRFFHRFATLDEVAAAGANTINVHHATPINPFINYPFLRTEEMKEYVDRAHARGFKVKLYYTVRELTNRAPELFALRSLGHEVLSDGPGGGTPWLREHVVSDYIAGWYVPHLKDEAIINSGTSRWHNYYLEGLNWLVRNVGIDGLYIDDVAFDRTVMKRVRKILDRGRQGALIDLHSANQFNLRDGFANSANLYLEHFPYLNRLWFGEYFDYDSPPDFWLVEVSGIPFGLMGEMLQDGGNPWRGMIYGMTGRLPWAGDPTKVWQVWDDFGIQDSKMIGYWVPDCPVKTDHPDVLATAYVRPGRSLISLASWADGPVKLKLSFDWERLGIDARNAELIVPGVDGFQPEVSFFIESGIPVAPAKGWLLILRERTL